jgi:NAD(P)-dependent dehydrogenase (short-subunit alcohol dehydrogenase family)
VDILREKVAVITGAASGIGLAIAGACAAAGMRVALVDLPGAKLESAAASLREQGHTARAYGCDVSNSDSVRALAAAVQTDLGDTYLLCNNAGIAGVKRWAWKFSDADWQRTLDINLRGVLNGMQAFVPGMVERNAGHVVNTSSMAGLIPTPMNAPYCASKFAIVGLSEVFASDLKQFGSNVGISVLCPGLVKTAIGDMRTQQPQGLDAAEQQYNDALVGNMETAMDPLDVARLVLESVRSKRFYVLTHPEAMALVEGRLRKMIDSVHP